ncbi:MAG: helix-hairpin-helix domain-containing protein [Gemmatimonadota bacterium]|nr:MAG: helix-hairpin-helix domain-containing protein [Gemmatimonadota bacterium]
MATRDERRATLILLGLACAGLVVRLLALSGTAPGDITYRAAGGDRPTRDSLAAKAGRLARPLAPDEKIDLDLAPADELARLPRIGPALAARIVTDRTINGPFGSLAGLDRVSGVGPTLLRGIEPHAVFSGRSRKSPDRQPDLVRLSTATAEELAQLPGIGPVKAKAIVRHREQYGPFRSVENLTNVRGIGRATVDRIRQLVRP